MAISAINWPVNEHATGEAAVRAYPSTVFLDEGVSEPAWQETTSRMYLELRDGLFGFLSRLGLNTDAAEDVVQETFFRLARQLRSGKRIENPPAWIFHVAHHLCMDFHRANCQSRSRLTSECESIAEPVDFNANPERAYLQKEKVCLVRTAMMRLTPQQLRCFQMRAIGFRYREIAADLGVSEQRAIHLVKRALERLGRIRW